MRRRTVRLCLGLLVLLLAGYGVRGIILPADWVAVFVRYDEGASWQPAPASPLFQDGEIAFAGFEPIQLAGEDLGAWDEVVIVNFDRAADYGEFASRIAAEDDIARYHLLDIAPQAPELLHLMNWRLRGYRDDALIDPEESVPIEVMFTARPRVEAQVHQRAGLNAESSAGYWVKPYAEFKHGQR